MSNLLFGGEHESLVRETAESAFLAVQETLAPSVEREIAPGVGHDAGGRPAGDYGRPRALR